MMEIKCNRCGQALISPHSKCGCHTKKAHDTKKHDLTKNIKTNEFDLRKGF